MDFKLVREQLRRAREQSHLTLDELAEKSGHDRATIHSIENIKREPDLKPKLTTLEGVAAAMGLTMVVYIDDFAGPGRTTDKNAIAPTDPLLVGLNREDLVTARSYHDATTPLRQRVSALLADGLESHVEDFLRVLNDEEGQRLFRIYLTLSGPHREMLVRNADRIARGAAGKAQAPSQQNTQRAAGSTRSEQA